MSQKAPPSWTFTKLTPYRDNIPQFINTYKLLQIKQKQERDENFYNLPCYTETSLAKTWILQGLSCALSLTLMLNQIIHFNSLIWEMFCQLVLLKQWVCFIFLWWSYRLEFFEILWLFLGVILMEEVRNRWNRLKLSLNQNIFSKDHCVKKAFGALF